MVRRLKIAVFHLAFLYSGGGEKLVLKEARLLAERGHEVTIFVPALNRRGCFPDLVSGIRIKTMLSVPDEFMAGHESFLILVTCLLAPLLSLKFRGYDVVLAANQPSCWIAFLVKKLFKVPYVSYLAQPTRFLYPRNIDKETGLYFTKRASESVSAKLMWLGQKFIAWADRVSIKGSDVILSNGLYVQKMLKSVYGVNAVSCPAGADYLSYRVGSKKAVKRYVLITNRHFSQKRFEYGVVAFSNILNLHPDCSLIITGTPTSYTDEIKLLVARLGLSKKVKFCGYVEEKKLAKLYRGASAYLYTAPEEDFGMGVIEAMGYGVPVVAWDKTGPAYTVINGKTGFLARPYDVGDFSEKLNLALSQGEKVKKMAENAIKHVRKNYSWARHVGQVEKALIKLVEDRYNLSNHGG